MKKINIIMVSILVVLSLFGCGKNDGIGSKEAENIAMEQFKKDVKEHNETSVEKIKMEEVVLLSKETNFSSSSKAWEITFNYKDGLSKEDEVSNSIAQYSVDPEGEIVRKSSSF
ncbi:hypothetical protein LCL96_02205 [Rossellomorea aquimaris]|uniref:hypothetical protein n=1 Tax=Rossellomorea TaxID=2837508 RepID=UPI001CD5D062|nr:hypothetical protein [Rossellomorea aquimaris]MCA1057725.1 hypothetical protein [Rossellomorea aquimaris]